MKEIKTLHADDSADSVRTGRLLLVFFTSNPLIPCRLGKAGKACYNDRIGSLFWEGGEPMQRFDDHVELDETEASGGVKEHGVRYVLAISLLLAIIVLSLMWIVPATTR